MKNDLQVRVDELVLKHGSLRKAGRVVGLTGQYLYRLQVGEKKHPSDAALKKLGLRRVVYYVRLNATERGKQQK